ncbi:MAG: hypothetical protein ACQKBU_09970, partial [Verrucomicrobiales bacterium]
MARFFLPLLTLSLLLTGVLHAAWEECKLHGRGYVSTTSMKSFYSFDRLVNNGKSISLENDRVKINLRIRSEE